MLQTKIKLTKVQLGHPIFSILLCDYIIQHNLIPNYFNQSFFRRFVKSSLLTKYSHYKIANIYSVSCLCYFITEICVLLFFLFAFVIAMPQRDSFACRALSSQPTIQLYNDSDVISPKTFFFFFCFWVQQLQHNMWACLCFVVLFFWFIAYHLVLLLFFRQASVACRLFLSVYWHSSSKNANVQICR